MQRLVKEGLPGSVKLDGDCKLLKSLVTDATGDRLDAVLCALQAAQALTLRDKDFGLPALLDPLEGWIATVPP